MVRAEKQAKEEKVAPHAGAWIETIVVSLDNLIASVAPHAGAWIETQFERRRRLKKKVAPHAGAWIETGLSPL